MFWAFVFWASLVAGLAIGIVFFRDLGDVSQMFIKVGREQMLKAIRNEQRTVAIGAGLTLLMVIAHGVFGAGPAWVFWLALLVLLILFVFPLFWVHIGLRNQQETARYYSLEQARERINPATSVLVIDHHGVARAHPDYELSRPHLASTPDGLAGENVVMSYCAMANLGVAYKAEIDGRKLDLAVLGQHGNNLLLRDNETNEPIQHIYGQRTCDLAPSSDGKSHCDLTAGRVGMPQWPTYRMSFRAFQKAFPDGTVFLNLPPSNPLLRLIDMAIDAVFSLKLAQHQREEAPVIDNMTHYDDRLPNKTYIWGVDIGGDAVAYTEDFVFECDNVVNATIGGRHVVIAYDPKFESLGVWYNDSGEPLRGVDFYGMSEQGQLQRVESLKPGMFWHVWAEYYQSTDINRIDQSASAAA